MSLFVPLEEIWFSVFTNKISTQENLEPNTTVYAYHLWIGGPKVLSSQSA